MRLHIKAWAQGVEASHCLHSGLAFLQVELKSQEAQSLQEQRDQCLSHLQQYAAAYQQHLAAYEQLTSEKEAVHKQLLLQTQLMDQLQHEEVQSKMAAEMARQELQKTQVRQLLRLGPSRRTLPPLYLLTLSWPLRSAWKPPARRTSNSRPS